jgi:WD40 repeat protein
MGVVAGRRARCCGLMRAAALGSGLLLAADCAVATGGNAAGTAGATAAGSGTRLWVSRYKGAGNGIDATSVAVSPGGRRVYVTGPSAVGGSRADYATVAYSAVTGARVWVSRYNGPGNGYDYATAVAVSPDGRTVYVTGSVYGGLASVREYATVAYRAATGARRWVAIYPNQSPYGYGPAYGSVRMVVSPDGRTVYVTGHAVSGAGSGGAPAYGFGTVAYAAATGARLWASVYAPAHGGAVPGAIGISPDGTRIFVTGTSDPAGRATVAYDAATGGRLWASSSHTGNGLTTSLAVSPGGGTVFVSGSAGARLSLDTIAYDAATGARRWESRGPPGQGWSLAVSPDGTRVFATGYARDRNMDYLTVGYDAATGTRKWASRYGGPAFKDNGAVAAAVSPDGRTVYVTGASSRAVASQPDCATVAYAASTGAQQWSQRYNGPANRADTGTAIAVGPAGRTLFVTGFTTGATSGYDFLTIAYRA